QSINDLPLGIVRDKSVRFFQDKRGRRKNGKVEVEDGFEEKVALVKIFPSIQGEIIEKLIEDGYKGIVLEGTGLGHTPESLFSGIEKAIEKNIPVAMTSQCIWGRTNMRVYSTGRDLLDLGVFPVEDMLPETALVKMMWILDKTQEMEEVQARMKENIAGEISSRTRADTFLKPKIPGEE
ncbi:glutamyl-tRNA amidotransferase, partial [candidate division MSBL1 archaeon SCGC-AAA259I14]